MENTTEFQWNVNISAMSNEFSTDNSSSFSNTTSLLCPDATWPPEKAAVVFWANSVVGFAFIIFGFIGNAISIIVLACERPTTTTSILLQGVAVSDTLYLLSNLFYSVFVGMNKYRGEMVLYLRALHPLLMPYIKPLMYISQQASVWLIVLVTLDRNFVITNPLQAAANPRTKRTQLKVVLVFFIVIVYNIPHFFELELTPCVYPDGAKGYIMTNSDLGNSMIYYLVYGIGCYFITMYVVPMLILAVINTKLILFLRRAAKQRIQLSEGKGKRKRDDVTLVLVVVVLVFAACQTPDFLLQIYYFELVVIGGLKMSAFGLNMFLQITALLLIVNASVNFLIYCLCGERFRQGLMRLFCRRKKCDNGSSRTGITSLSKNSSEKRESSKL